jgi:hypothetical protein
MTAKPSIQPYPIVCLFHIKILSFMSTFPTIFVTANNILLLGWIWIKLSLLKKFNKNYSFPWPGGTEKFKEILIIKRFLPFLFSFLSMQYWKLKIQKICTFGIPQFLIRSCRKLIWKGRLIWWELALNSDLLHSLLQFQFWIFFSLHS